MKRGGRYVDPLEIQLPPAEPLPEDEYDAFGAVRTQRLALLQTIPDTLQLAD